MIRLAMLLFVATAACAQCAPPNYSCALADDSRIIPLPAPFPDFSPVGAGQMYADPVFNSVHPPVYTRVTDTNTSIVAHRAMSVGSGSGDNRYFNLNDTLFTVYDSGLTAYFYGLNPATMQTGLLWENTVWAGGDGVWSQLNPEYFYVTGADGVIRKFDFTGCALGGKGCAPKMSAVYNFISGCALGTTIAYRAQAETPGANDNVFGATYSYGVQGTGDEVVAYNQSSKSCYSYNTRFGTVRSYSGAQTAITGTLNCDGSGNITQTGGATFNANWPGLYMLISSQAGGTNFSSYEVRSISSATSGSLVNASQNGICADTPINFTSAAKASGGHTTYTGSGSNIADGSFGTCTVHGFDHTANNGVFPFSSSTADTITLANPNGVSERNPNTFAECTNLSRSGLNFKIYPGKYLGSVAANGSPNGDRFSVHDVYLDPGGTWLIVVEGDYCYSSTCQIVHAWQVGTVNVVNCLTSCGGHHTESALGFFNFDYIPGTQFDPAEVIFRPWSKFGTTRLSDLSYLNTTFPVTLCFVPQSGCLFDNHPSNKNDASGTHNYPLITSTVANEAYGSITASLSNEIIGYPQPSGPILRFGHTFDSTLSTNNFTAQFAIGSASSTGNFYMFTTDAEGTLGNVNGGSTCTLGIDCRSDVFILNLAP